MYEKDGEQYFIVDSHLHFWDASPENWVPGQEDYAKGWISCFHDYQSLGPPETHDTIEKFRLQTADDFEQEVFVNGKVDFGILESTYLRDWYTKGFNDIEQNAKLLERFPSKLRVNGRFDPRDGEAGLRQLEQDAKTYDLKGVKLYTAEWKGSSRGWKLDDPTAVPFFEKLLELGIHNVHVHKGPTIWPLDKDAFDVADVDRVATSYPTLNFIVEHVGLPRIEDFCYMATQEPNVYAGLSVVTGALMHARPRFFAKVMGELLFWVGEDKMLFGSDYGIWTPQWQIEGLLDWDYPDATFDDFPRWTDAGKRKILGLNAARLYDIPVPEHLQLAPDQGTPAARDDAKLVGEDSPLVGGGVR
jgi:predicted TIM-barrel fold metal-dependent hydrolase